MTPIQSRLLRVARLGLLGGAGRQLCHLDRLGLRRLHDTVDVNTRNVDGVRRQASDRAVKENFQFNYGRAQRQL